MTARDPPPPLPPLHTPRWFDSRVLSVPGLTALVCPPMKTPRALMAERWSQWDEVTPWGRQMCSIRSSALCRSVHTHFTDVIQQKHICTLHWVTHTAVTVWLRAVAAECLVSFCVTCWLDSEGTKRLRECLTDCQHSFWKKGRQEGRENNRNTAVRVRWEEEEQCLSCENILGPLWRLNSRVRGTPVSCYFIVIVEIRLCRNKLEPHLMWQTTNKTVIWTVNKLNNWIKQTKWNAEFHFKKKQLGCDACI